MTLLCRGGQFVVNGVGVLCGTITPTNTPLFGLLQFITNNTNPPTVFSYHCHPQSHLQSISNNKISFHYFKPNPLSSSRPTVMSTSSGISTARAVSENGGGQNDGSPVFALSKSSLLKINKGDITKWFVDGSSDAIVNPANEKMLGGGGADGAIHRAAGPELRDACYAVPEVRPGIRCPTGEARITPGFRLPASHVIHTVGPIYDLDSNPQASLRNSYRSSLTVAKDNNIKFIAFPAISCGVYGYPFEEAAMIAISTVKESANDFKEVHFVLFSDDIYNVWLKKAKEVLQS